MEEATQAANKEHRRQINGYLVTALTALGLSDDNAKAVVSAVARGQIDFMTIDY